MHINVMSHRAWFFFFFFFFFVVHCRRRRRRRRAVEAIFRFGFRVARAHSAAHFGFRSRFFEFLFSFVAAETQYGLLHRTQVYAASYRVQNQIFCGTAATRRRLRVYL